MKPYTTGDGSNMTRIINARHFGRLTSLISSTDGTVFGGNSDQSKLVIEPTLVTDVKLSDQLMVSEIFGPILAIIPYDTLAEVPKIIAQVDPTPLGLYLFSEDPKEADFIRASTSSGGMAINEVMGQVAVTSLAFGGFGTSGFGSYRGKAGIDTFSHRKSVATLPTTAEFEGLLEWRYPNGDREAKFQILKQNLEGKLVE
jgi:acyl-CoA reductase-like NAD-dependent aldehyde dehydrogenase